MNESYSELSLFIENKRKALGLDLDEMADYLNISRTTLWRIYSGEKFGISTLKKISSRLKISRKKIIQLQGGLKQ